MPQQRNQKTTEPKTQAMLLRVHTASNTETLYMTAKWSKSRGMQRRYYGSHRPGGRASAIQVPPTKITPWKPTNANTLRYLPVSNHQRGTGFDNNTPAALGSR